MALFEKDRTRFEIVHDDLKVLATISHSAATEIVSTILAQHNVDIADDCRQLAISMIDAIHRSARSMPSQDLYVTTICLLIGEAGWNAMSEMTGDESER
jgi:hypothetical protein